MKKSSLLALSLLSAAIIIVGGGAMGLYLWSRNWVEIHNASGQRIESLSVRVCKQRLEFQDVAAGATEERAFDTLVDDHFSVEGRLADGTEIKGQFGYVTNGMMHSRARIVVHEDGTIEGSQDW